MSRKLCPEGHIPNLEQVSRVLALVLGTYPSVHFLAASQIRGAILLAVMYTMGFFFVLFLPRGMLSGCFNLLALRTILDICMTGQRSGLALSDNKVIVWLFWQFLWMRHVILTELATSKDELLITFIWHLDLSKKATSLVGNAFMTWWPDG